MTTTRPVPSAEVIRTTIGRTARSMRNTFAAPPTVVMYGFHNIGVVVSFTGAPLPGPVLDVSTPLGLLSDFTAVISDAYEIVGSAPFPPDATDAEFEEATRASREAVEEILDRYNGSLADAFDADESVVVECMTATIVEGGVGPDGAPMASNLNSPYVADGNAPVWLKDPGAINRVERVKIDLDDEEVGAASGSMVAAMARPYFIRAGEPDVMPYDLVELLERASPVPSDHPDAEACNGSFAEIVAATAKVAEKVLDRAFPDDAPWPVEVTYRALSWTDLDAVRWCARWAPFQGEQTTLMSPV